MKDPRIPNDLDEWHSPCLEWMACPSCQVHMMMMRKMIESEHNNWMFLIVLLNEWVLLHGQEVGMMI